MYEIIQKQAVSICLYTFSWFGIGLPFIWLRTVHPEAVEHYQLAFIILPAVLLFIFGLVCAVNCKQVLLSLFRLKFAWVFVLFLSITLIWSPISDLEKITLLLSIALCSAAAFSALIVLGWKETWVIIIVSLSTYILATLTCSLAAPYLPFQNIVVVYALLFFGGAIVLFSYSQWPDYSSKTQKLVLVGVCLIILAAIFFALLGHSVENSLVAKKHGWLLFRFDYGLFLNTNLHNRLLQVLLLAVLVTGLNFDQLPKSKNTLPFVALISIAFITCTLLIAHRATNGRFFLASIILMFIIYHLVRFGGANRGKFRKPTAAEILCVALVVCAISSSLWFSGYAYQFSLQIAAVLERHDFQSRYHIWESAIGLLDFHQLTVGVGLGGFWQGEMTLSSSDPFLINKAHAHNGFLDLVLQSGAVSTLLLFLAVLSSYFQSSAIPNNNAKHRTNIRPALIFVMVSLIVMNLFESALLPTSSATMLPFMILLLILFRSLEEVSRCGREKAH